MNKVKSVDLFSHISAPVPYPTKQYAEQTKKIGILSQFCDLQGNRHVVPTGCRMPELAADKLT